MTTSESATGERRLYWFQGVPTYAWIVLVIASLGWMFDTFDQQLFTLIRASSVRELLAPRMLQAPEVQLKVAVSAVGTQLTAVFLLGWATGGFVFGMVGDRLGRTRTMVLTILIYAAFTGLNGLVGLSPWLNALLPAPWQYAICRFIVAMGVGGEFAAGASLVAEVWPDRSRAMALGSLQMLSAVGNIAAALSVLVLSAVSWRWVFAIGAIPALLVVWIMRSVHEPEKWQAAREAAKHDGDHKDIGSIAALFREPDVRRKTIAAVLLATAGVGAAWGAGFFSPDFVQAVLRPRVELSPAVVALPVAERAAAVATHLKQYGAYVFLFQMLGAVIGMFGFAAVAERIGRRRAIFLVFASAFVSMQAFFRFVHDPISAYVLAFVMGIFGMAVFSAYTVYFPELFPTRLRATGVGFCYNAARVLAAGAPFALGKFQERFAVQGQPGAGFRTAASIVLCIFIVGFIGLLFAPETKGKPLPE